MNILRIPQFSGIQPGIVRQENTLQARPFTVSADNFERRFTLPLQAPRRQPPALKTASLSFLA